MKLELLLVLKIEQWTKETEMLVFLKILFIHFRQRGRETEREGEKHQCVVASHMLPTGNPGHKPDKCPDWELNWWPFGLQAAPNPLSHTSQGYFVYNLTWTLN